MPRDDLSVHSLTRWDDLIGNEEAKRGLARMIQYRGIPPKVFLAGPAGSGKSTIINHQCKVAACHQPNGTDPCGHCSRCQKFIPGHRNTGIFAAMEWDSAVQLHYLSLNCRNITAAVLHNELESIRNVDGIRIVHLEEASNLKRLQCDESITELLDDPDFADCRWIASAVTDQGLDPQFRRRWNCKLVTSAPAEHPAACFLAKRCREYGIRVDHPRTLQLLVQKSWGVMGLALSVLAASILNEHRLTQDMVQSYPFPMDDPWQQSFFET
jgi:hypothetical protein